jgi:hypothetical protein
MRPLSSDYDADPDRFLATDRHPHDDVHPYVEAAAGVAATLDLPMTLTMRGCVVYGTKTGTPPRSA